MCSCKNTRELEVKAIDRDDFSDFEDCLQMYCGIENYVSYIVTNNGKDFEASDIPAITPEQMLSVIKRKRDS